VAQDFGALWGRGLVGYLGCLAIGSLRFSACIPVRLDQKVYSNTGITPQNLQGYVELYT
jgi:hypothetical protein